MEVKIKAQSANQDSDDQVLSKTERILGIFYDSGDDEISLCVNISNEDRFISLSLDRSEFVKALTDTLVEPE